MDTSECFGPEWGFVSSLAPSEITFRFAGDARRGTDLLLDRRCDRPEELELKRMLLRDAVACAGWKLALVIAIALAWGTSALGAPAVGVVFTSTTGTGAVGGATIDVAPGDIVTATIRLSADTAGVSSYALSIEFDSDLNDELDLISVTEALPVGFQFNLTSGVASTQESSSSQMGNVLTFEAGTFGAGPASTTFAIGTIEFQVSSNVARDGPDIFSGAFNVGFDDIFDNQGVRITDSASFGSASVGVPVVPGLGLPGLLLLTALFTAAALRELRRSPAARA